MRSQGACCDRAVWIYLCVHLIIIVPAIAFYVSSIGRWPFESGRLTAEVMGAASALFFPITLIANLVLWRRRRDPKGRKCRLRLLDFFLCGLHFGCLMPGWM